MNSEEALHGLALHDVGQLAGPSGEWVREYEPASSVVMLSRFAVQSPVPGSPVSAWHSFFWVSAVLPIILVVAGGCAATIVFTGVHSRKPKSIIVRFFDSLCCSLCSGTPWRRLVAGGAVTITTLWVAASVVLATKSYVLSTLSWQLGRASQDVEMAAKLATALNESGTSVLTSLKRLKTDCSNDVEEYLGKAVDDIANQIKGYLEEVNSISGVLVHFPADVEAFHIEMDRYGGYLTLCLVSPWVMVLLCGAVIIATAWIAEHSGRACARRCEHCEISFFGRVCVAPAVLLVSIAAGLELLLGIVTSGLCLVPDETVLGFARHSFGQNSGEFDMARYYIRGSGVNPGFEHLRLAEKDIVDAIAWVRHYGDVLAKTCPQWGQESSAISNLQIVQYSVNETQSLLAPQNVYPYYQTVVHGLLCDSLPGGLAKVALLQILLAFVCLPALLFLTVDLVDSLIDERALAHGAHNFDLLAQDSDGDGHLY